MISDAHQAMLEKSGIMLEHAIDRGYETITESERLRVLGFVNDACGLVPGLLVPVRDVRGSVWGYQYRPDVPRVNKDGRAIKYETPWHQYMGIDIPLDAAANIDDPTVPLFITEGSKKADCAALHGLCCVALLGVWGFRARNPKGGIGALGAWNDVVLNGRRVIISYDGDLARKPSVAKAVCYLAEFLKSRKAVVEFLHLPDETEKVGIDDFLMSGGHTVQDLWRLVRLDQPPIRWRGAEKSPEPESEPEPEPVEPITMAEAHAVFRKWLGKDYDTDALDVCLAAVAVEKLDGDPLWMLVVSGPGNAKTETVQPFHSVGGIVVGSISGEAALLSATPERERHPEATGGLLRQLGDRGLVVIKDVTSILSMDHLSRDKVLSAFREIYDGHWVRNVGAEGGRLIPWAGRVAVIGAVTTAWDTHHAVIAKMGDRFTLLRMNSRDKDTRMVSGRRAMFNTGDEVTMRKELAEAVAGVIAGMNTEGIRLTEVEMNIIVAAADLTTLARTSVECDFRGDVIDAHDPEMPTRCAKQLGQRVRGAVAIGMDRVDAMKLAIRCARDSMPPLRMSIIDYLAKHPHSSTQEVRKGWTSHA